MWMSRSSVTYSDLIIETLFLSSFLRGLYLLSDK